MLSFWRECGGRVLTRRLERSAERGDVAFDSASRMHTGIDSSAGESK